MTTAAAPGALADALAAEMFNRDTAGSAALLGSASIEEQARLLSLDASHAGAVIAAMAPSLGAQVLGAVDPATLRAAVAVLGVDSTARLLARLTPEHRESRLAALDEATAAELSDVVTYPAGQLGSVMDPAAPAFRATSTAEVTLEALRRRAGPPTRDVFVLDDRDGLVGAIPVMRVAVAEPQTQLRELGLEEPSPLRATDPVDEVLQLGAELRDEELPIVDLDGRLVGVVHARGLLAAAEEAATAGMQRMVGVGSEERALSPPLFAVRKRLPWLYVNLLTAFLAATVVGVFESTIARFTALAVLLPVVAGQSGNSGAQALAVSMRGLALREIRASHWRRVGLKELAVGFVNGVAIAVVTAAGVFVWSQSFGLALVIFIAMIISMTLAGVAGALIPITLRILRQDPAQSSSIVLTTVTDVVGFTSFLGLATILSSIL